MKSNIDRLGKLKGFDSLLIDPHVDDSPTIDELGIQTIPFVQTLADMAQWMHQSGKISAKLAGKLAD